MNVKTMMFKRLLNLMFLGLFAILSACVPVEKRTECASDEAFNPNLRVCVPTIGTNSNVVFISDKFPQTGLSITQGDTNTYSFSVSISDVYSKGFIVVWNLRKPNGTTSQLDFDTTSINTIFSAQPIGLYTVEATLKDATNTTIIGSTSWSVSIGSASQPELTNINPSAGSITKSFSDSVQVFTVDRSDITANFQWYLNGVLDSGNVTGSYSLNPGSLTVGNHLLEVHLTDGVSIYDRAFWSINITNPSLTNVTINPTQTSVTVIDSVSVPDGGFLLNGSTIADVSGHAFCLEVDNYLGTRNSIGISNVYAKFYLDGQVIGGSAGLDFAGNGTTNKRCVTHLTGYNNFSVSLPSHLLEIGQSKTLTAKVFDKGVNGTDLTDNPLLLAKEVSWGLAIRPKNTAPIISSDTNAGSPVASTTVNVTQDTASTFVVAIADEDSDPTQNADFEIRWYIDGVLLDGVNTFPDSTDLTPDCFHTFNDGAHVTPTVNKYNCDVVIPSALTTGPNTNTSYTLTAVVSDTSKYPGGVSKDSNILTWPLQVSEAQTTDPLLAGIQDYTTAPVPGNNSYIALQSAPTTPLATVTENSDVVLKIVYRDPESDNFYRLVEMCKTYTSPNPASTASNCTILSGMQLVNRTDDDEYYTSEYQFRMPESAITAAANGDVYFRISVQDVPTTVTGTLFQKIFTININNDNPQPVVDTTNLAPALTPVLPMTAYNVYAGMPFSFYPGVVTDASQTDGATPQYQWQVCLSGCTIDGDWKNITGATEHVLHWTPPAELAGQSVQIRVCIGDDGLGNELSAQCTATPTAANPTNVSVVGPWQNITIHSNQVTAMATDPFGASYFATGELSTWSDPSAPVPTVYTAYSTGAAPGAGVIIEKVIYNGDATPHASDIRSIHMLTEVSGNSYEAQDLSIIGDPSTKSLYVAYMVQDELTIPTNLTTLRIRKVDIEDDRFGFNYNGQLPGPSLVGVPPVTINTQSNFDKDSTIQVTGTGWAGTGIQINGVNFLEGVDFLEGSSASEAAFNLATAINNSTDPAIIYRFTASVSGTQVTLKGLPTDDYVDVQIYAKQVGKIMYDDVNKEIHIPFIDAINNDKISIISLSTQFSLGDGPNNPIQYLQLDSTDGAVEFDNDYSPLSQYFYFAIKTFNGYFSLHAYNDLNSSAVDKKTGSDTAIFGVTVSNVRVAASTTGNGHIFLAATDGSNNLMLARMEENQFMGSVVSGTNLETNLIANVKDGKLSSSTGSNDQFLELSDIKLKAIPNEPQGALLYVSTNNSSSHNPNNRLKTYMVKLTSDDPNVSTSPIKMINTSTQINSPLLDVVENFDISFSDIALSRTFGDNGYTSAENTKNVIFVNYVTGTDTTGQVQGKFINITEEEIPTTTFGILDGFAPAYIEKIP